MDNDEYELFRPLITHNTDVENFLKYAWTKKILDLFYKAGLIDENTSKKYFAVALSYYKDGFKGILGYEIGLCNEGKISSIDKAYTEAFKSLRSILEHKIPKIISFFESIYIFASLQKGDDPSGFSLSHVCRYYETGVKSTLGESLAEYGFPTDAIRRLEEKHTELLHLGLPEAKQYCRKHYDSIKSQFDDYENKLFVKAMNSF